MMNSDQASPFNLESLQIALRQMLACEISDVTYEQEQLHGGTMGNVWLVTGHATSKDGSQTPFALVWKRQQKWARYGDPDSWRREYDLYRSPLAARFTDDFRWPICYHAEMNEAGDEIQLWMAYIAGVTGLAMTGDNYVRAAEALGAFQGRLYARQPDDLRAVSNLSSRDYMFNFYRHYRSWNRVYDYVRADNCAFPRHLSQMLIEIDEQAEEIIARIERLPVVLCHRDFWVTNIVCSTDTIFAIDWDTAGWGYLGEDLASLLADEADVANMVEYYQRCLPAYYRGFARHAGIDPLIDNCVYEMMLLLFGYRLVEWYLDAAEGEARSVHLQTLQQIYAIGQLRAQM